MFRSQHHIVHALERLEDGHGPKTSSIVGAERPERDPDADPFHPGFLTALERRTEVIHLLRGLDERSQRLLVLWFVEGRPVTEIASTLGISRVHCYRLRDKALDRMMLESKRSREDVRRAI
jgi:DNA-directed RNA polymerase specialized sigma24 family protein